MSDLTMGLAAMMANQNKTEVKSEPSESVKLYTLIKDYAQRKYKCDDNTVMRLYIGTKRAPKITDNGALIAYVDGKMNPEPKVKKDIKQSEIKESKPQVQSIQVKNFKNRISDIKDCFGDDVIVENYKDKVKVTITDSKQEFEIKEKMKENGYTYNTKRGFSYFFVKS